MKRIDRFVAVFLFCVFLFGISVMAEDITLTTYYPAPYGAYDELTTTGNTFLSTSTGSVGIGVSDPKSKMDVEGGLAIGAGYSGTTAAPTNGMIVEGKVGIGTSSVGASDALAVGGVVNATSYSTGTDTGATGTFTTLEGKTVTVKNGIVVSITGP
jgi:hypothetical protein